MLWWSSFLSTCCLSLQLWLCSSIEWILLRSTVGGEDPTCTENGLSTEVGQLFQMSKMLQEPQMSNLSGALVPLQTGGRGGGRSTCRCGSREPTSCANDGRWRAERSCLQVPQKTPLKLQPLHTTQPLCLQRPVRLTCPSRRCLWECPSPNHRCLSPSPFQSLQRLSLLSIWVKKRQELTTGPQAGGDTGSAGNSDPTKALRRGHATDGTATVKRGPRQRAWTSPRHHKRFNKWDGHSARRRECWTREKRRRKEMREKNQTESRMTVGHASPIHTLKLERIVAGECLSEIIVFWSRKRA